MERFNEDELAPIQKALLAFTNPHEQAAALSKACRIAQQVDERLQAGVEIEAHPEADALTKAVIGAVLALAKREKGAPLSDAELKQRQEAARGRKEGAAAVAGGAAVGAAASVARDLRPGSKMRAVAGQVGHRASQEQSKKSRFWNREANALSNYARKRRVEAAGHHNPNVAAAIRGDAFRSENVAAKYQSNSNAASGAAASVKQDATRRAMRGGMARGAGKAALAGAALAGGVYAATRMRAEKAAPAPLRKGEGHIKEQGPAPNRDAPSGHRPSRKGAVGWPQNVHTPPRPKKKKHPANRSAKGPTEKRHLMDPEVVSKTIASLPLAKRAVAEGLQREGRHEDLQKFLGPALMAARAALPSVARAASSVGSRLFGAGAGAKAASGVMAGGRAGIRGLASAERGVKRGAAAVGAAGKKAWGAAKSGAAAAATGIGAAADSWQASRMGKPTARATSSGRPAQRPASVNPNEDRPRFMDEPVKGWRPSKRQPTGPRWMD